MYVLLFYYKYILLFVPITRNQVTYVYLQIFCERLVARVNECIVCVQLTSVYLHNEWNNAALEMTNGTCTVYGAFNIR